MYYRKIGRGGAQPTFARRLVAAMPMHFLQAEFGLRMRENCALRHYEASWRWHAYIRIPARPHGRDAGRREYIARPYDVTMETFIRHSPLTLEALPGHVHVVHEAWVARE